MANEKMKKNGGEQKNSPKEITHSFAQEVSLRLLLTKNQEKGLFNFSTFCRSLTMGPQGSWGSGSRADRNTIALVHLNIQSIIYNNIRVRAAFNLNILFSLNKLRACTESSAIGLLLTLFTNETL